MDTLEHLEAERKVREAKCAESEKYWAKFYKRKLLDILAVTHRDGGHYTSLVGVEKSVDDAMTIISNAVVK